MKTLQTSIIKASSLEIVLIVVAITASILTIFISPANNSHNNAIAQPDYFEQPVKVNIDTTDYVLGEYGVIVNNLDTGDSISNLYTNSEESSRYQTTEGSISSHDGDSLMACVKDMSTDEMACDKQTTFYDDSKTVFFVDMNDARYIDTSED
jgi:hypothetical protein